MSITIETDGQADGLVKVISDPATFFQELGSRRLEPVLLIQGEPFRAAVEYHGAQPPPPPDPWEPYQLSLSLYIGGTTPQATTEVVHHHPDQTEAYVMVEGEALLVAKYRGQADWVAHLARTGDLLIVQPDVCHWFRWQSARGLALVFKAPQRAGVGRFPAGKNLCAPYCQFSRGCMPPPGFQAE